ncbi:MAG: transposase [Candidatus Gottesmanbacteria bacterium]
MPQKHSVKSYILDGIYHVYNRGVEKRLIFLEDQDYRVFLNLLKESLIHPQHLQQNCQDDTLTNKRRRDRPPKNFYESIQLLAYCLMPNHFHFMIKQCDAHSLDKFIKTVCTRYSMYVNKKYKRVGTLFQGTYKAVLVTEEPYFLHLSRYIHRNPIDLFARLESAYSSYAEYLEKRHTEWIQTDSILALFQPKKLPFLKKTITYQSFVESTNPQGNWMDGIMLDDDELEDAEGFDIERYRRQL